MEPDKMLEQLKEKEEKLRNELVELEQMFGAKKEQYLKQLESYFSLPGATTSPSTGVGGVNFTK